MMSTELTLPIVEVVGELVARAGGSEILLVYQQRASSSDTFWELPGGKLVPGETLADAVIRELREESGLIVTTVRDLLVTIMHESERRTLMEFIFEVGCWHGELALEDPEMDILDVRFWPRVGAIAELERSPWRYASEPLVTYLR